jgi:hypothetical protein
MLPNSVPTQLGVVVLLSAVVMACDGRNTKIRVSRFRIIFILDINILSDRVSGTGSQNEGIFVRGFVSSLLIIKVT